MGKRQHQKDKMQVPHAVTLCEIMRVFDSSSHSTYGIF